MFVEFQKKKLQLICCCQHLTVHTAVMSLSLVLALVAGAARGTPTTIMSIFIDDLGFYDTQVAQEPAPYSSTNSHTCQ